MRDTRTTRLPPAPLPLWLAARNTDPETSRAAAASIDRRGLCAILERAYREAGASGLTDSEAAERVGIDGAWKRCSDLRRLGIIVPTGATRTAPSGRQQQVCRIGGCR